MIKIVKISCPDNRISVKCPFRMYPTRIVIHNTANDAPAVNEISYMHRNSKEVSFHYAVDDKIIVQGIDLDRNAWHAGDGRGKGNMEGIAIEICYSKSGGERFIKAQENAAELTAYLLKKYNWSIEKVTKHQDYSGKYCPHRTLDDFGWEYFLDLVKKYLDYDTVPAKKSDETIAKEVIQGKWGNGEERRRRLTEAGYSYTNIQNTVNRLMKKNSASKKTDEEIAREVIKGLWGNGQERKNRLSTQGYNYKAVQKIVNNILKQGL